MGEPLIQLRGTVDQTMMFQDDDKSGTALNKNYLYLDTCWTKDKMLIPNCLKGIHKVSSLLILHTKAGVSHTDKKGYLGGTTFWLDEHDITIMISLKTLEKIFHVTCDSKVNGGALVCQIQKGKITFPTCLITTFPYIDLSKNADGKVAMMVQSKRGSYKGYTQEDVERTILAHKMQAGNEHPIKTTFKREVSWSSYSSMFKDCPLITKDIFNAQKILGPSVLCIEGKWTRGRPEVVRPDYVSIHLELVKTNKYIMVAADVMLVLGLPFFVTLSLRIRYVTVQFVSRWTPGKLANTLKLVISLYRRTGFI